MSILWVSSMSKELYDKYGQHLINSFRLYLPTQHLWVTYDEETAPFVDNPPHLTSYSLAESRLLKKFYKKNKSHIPTKYGGLMSDAELHNTHKFNRRWFNWYKKVHTLFLATEVFTFQQRYRYIVWIDCDCMIKQSISNPELWVQKILCKEMKEYSIAYFLGKIRQKKDKGVESGLVFFDCKAKGVRLIKQWHNIYWEKKYYTYPRWDDGYLLKILIDQILPSEEKLSLSIDLGLTSTSLDTHVMSGCSLWKYIQHHKGEMG